MLICIFLALIVSTFQDEKKSYSNEKHNENRDNEE